MEVARGFESMLRFERRTLRYIEPPTTSRKPITGIVSKNAGGSRALVDELRRLLPLASSGRKQADGY
jgi:hypothetical protein